MDNVLKIETINGVPTLTFDLRTYYQNEDKINNKIDFDEFKRLIDFQIDNNVNAIVVCGTTGESSTMTTEEKKETIKFAIDVAAKRVPIIAGTGGNCTKSVIELTQFAEEAGADSVLIVTPYYNKTSQNGLVAHYNYIADRVKKPIILYNVPSRTGVNIKAETYKELSKHQNIVATKEASGDLSLIAEIKYLCGNDLDIYSGNDDQTVPIMSLGGIGVISVLSNIAPKVMHDICELYLNGYTQAAAEHTGYGNRYRQNCNCHEDYQQAFRRK